MFAFIVAVVFMALVIISLFVSELGPIVRFVSGFLAGYWAGGIISNFLLK